MARVAIAERTIELPEGVTIRYEDRTATVNGPKGQLSRVLVAPGVTVQQDGPTVKVTSEYPRRKEKALVGTFEAHLKNMVRGVTDGFSYRLKTVYSHFPIKTKVDGGTFVIDNFLGEKSPRKAVIVGETKVSVKGDEVIVAGTDKESVGQTAANIERATKVTKRDIRVFQDGIYLVSKEA